MTVVDDPAVCLSLQRAVLGLVESHDLLAAAAGLPELGHFLTQCRVFPLQEIGAHGDLVLLYTPRVPRTLRRQVVLLPPRPVPFVLKGKKYIYLYIKIHG